MIDIYRLFHEDEAENTHPGRPVPDIALLETLTMALVGRFLSLVGKLVLDKFIGTKRTDELVELIADWRENPKQAAEELAAAKQAIAEPSVLNEAVPQVTSEVNRAEVEQLIALAVPAISLESLGVGESANEDPPEAVAERFIKETLPSKKQNTYLLWLDPPYIEEGDSTGYCHFSYSFNEKHGQMTYRVRDYRNGKLYWGVTSPGNDKRWKLVPWGGRFTALQLWQVARARVPAYSGFFSIELFDEWKALLNDMTHDRPPKA